MELSKAKYPMCVQLGGTGSVVLPVEEELAPIHKSSYGVVTEAWNV